MRLEYIQKDHPDLPIEFEVIHADDLDTAIELAVMASQDLTKQVIVWEDAWRMFTKQERAIIQALNSKNEKIFQVAASLEEKDRDTGRHNEVLNKLFDDIVVKSDVSDLFCDNADEILKRAAHNFYHAINKQVELEFMDVHHRFNNVSDPKRKKCFHRDRYFDPNSFMVLSTFTNISSLFVAEQDVGEELCEDTSVYDLRDNVDILWQTPEFSAAFLLSTSKGGIVHTWPSSDIGSGLIKPNERRHLGIYDIKTKQPLFPVR